MTDQTQPEQRVSVRRLGPVTALAAGSLAGLVLGLGGVASAQTADTPAPSPSTSADADQGQGQSQGQGQGQGQSQSQGQGQAQDQDQRDRLCDEDDAPLGSSDSSDAAESSAAA